MLCPSLMPSWSHPLDNRRAWAAADPLLSHHQPAFLSGSQAAATRTADQLASCMLL